MGWSLWIVFSGVWIGCGVLAYGLMMAFWQRTFPLLASEDAFYTRHRRSEVLKAVWGPCALAAVLLLFLEKPWTGRDIPTYQGLLFRRIAADELAALTARCLVEEGVWTC